MPYCKICGAHLPLDEELRYCPSCGSYLGRERLGVARGELKPATGKSERLISLRARVLLLCLMFLTSVIVTSLGAASTIDPAEAQDMLQDLERLREVLDYAGLPLIFGNNLMYCLMMFVPLVGPISGFFVLYSTGLSIAAMSSSAGTNPLLILFLLFLYPHAWMEYLSYSLAISESILLVYALLRYKILGFKQEFSNALKAIFICATVLLLAAIIEMQLIATMR
ncbi:MAG: stage II sporulation protein M [Nitrososphaerota archaeon]|nr:stage II sporulation protein M [Candidatus Bathyarchaeota archaeon]MDW8049121.1 stage II sporulation protein M [Nitrososphaerota archaeon]